MSAERYSETLDEILTFYPFTKYEGINLPNNPEIVKDAGKRMEAIKNFDSLESDVILATPFKTGTHWVHEILSMLLTQKTDYNAAGTIMDRNFEALLDIEKAKNIPQPRLFHTHLPFQYLPRKHIENGYKIVKLNRNPKDRHVSMYHFVLGKTGVPNWSWSEYFKEFVIGDGDFNGGWFKHTKGWEDAMKKYPENIHSLSYESLTQDAIGTVTKLADFLKVPYTAEFIEEIIDKCKFDNLKDNKSDASRCIEPDGKSTLFRKGEIGDWKNWFTVAQNEEFQALFDKEMAGYDVGY